MIIAFARVGHDDPARVGHDDPVHVGLDDHGAGWFGWSWCRCWS